MSVRQCTESMKVSQLGVNEIMIDRYQFSTYIEDAIEMLQSFVKNCQQSLKDYKNDNGQLFTILVFQLEVASYTGFPHRV